MRIYCAFIVHLYVTMPSIVKSCQLKLNLRVEYSSQYPMTTECWVFCLIKYIWFFIKTSDNVTKPVSARNGPTFFNSANSRKYATWHVTPKSMEAKKGLHNGYSPRIYTASQLVRSVIIVSIQLFNDELVLERGPTVWRCFPTLDFN